MLDDVPQQITIDDAVMECDRNQLLAAQGDSGELEKLGDSDDFGYVILDLLDRQGWAVHVRAPFAGAIDDEGSPGVMIIAAHRFADVPDISMTGRSVAACAPQLVVETGKWVRAIVAAERRRRQAE